MSIFELAEKLKQLKDRKKELEEQVKVVNEEIEMIEQQLITEMLTDEIQNFNKDGYTYYLSIKPYASPVPESKKELFQKLKENGFGDLVYETINANSFNAFVREQMEENNGEVPDWLKPYVHIYEKQTIGIRKSK
mgnify:CR=1 FL=1